MQASETAAKYATWTPELVRDRLIEAVTWARYSAGRVGPAGYQSLMPAYHSTLDDHLLEGWGFPEAADHSAPEPFERPRFTPEQVDQCAAAIEWCAEYLCPNHKGDASMLNLWLRCKVYRKPLDKALRARGSRMSRRHAYRMRDRALSIISQGLEKDGVAI